MEEENSFCISLPALSLEIHFFSPLGLEPNTLGFNILVTEVSRETEMGMNTLSICNTFSKLLRPKDFSVTEICPSSLESPENTKCEPHLQI